MTEYQHLLNQSREWLLEAADPDPCYLAIRDLYAHSTSTKDLTQARQAAHKAGAIAQILEHMNPEGWWEKPGPGYGPKYRSTVWAMTLLAQLGASLEMDSRLDTACAYVLDHAFARGGYFTSSGAPSGTFDCLQGNLTYASLAIGCRDPRLQQAVDWMSRSQTGEGVAPVTNKKASVRYYNYKCGPDFRCAANGGLPCAWGATKVMMAFSQVPAEWGTELVERAIARGVELFFSVDPVTANWPCDHHINRDWWKFGFPLFYITDLLQVADSLTALGYTTDARMSSLIELILHKQISPGRWALEYAYKGKTWGSFGAIGKENKWVTIRALRVLKRIIDAV